MNEYSLNDILEEVHRREFERFDNAPLHIFSYKHRKAIKKILAGKYDTVPAKIRLNRKTAIILLVLIFLAVITAAFRIAGFLGHIYQDNIQMFVLDDSNAPAAVKEIYYLEALPEKYLLTESYGDIDDILIRRVYTNPESGDHITFQQYAKCEFDTHFDNEYAEIISAEINGCNGFIWKAKNPEKSLKVFSGIMEIISFLLPAN